MKYLYLDTETGGLDPDKDALFTIGLVAHDDDVGILGTLHLRVQPEHLNVAESALVINRIDLAEHKASASSREAAAKEVRAFVQQMFGEGRENQPFVVGHNVPFDLGFMRRLFADAKLQEPYSHRNLDTMGIALFMRDLGLLNLSDIKLDTLIAHYGVKIEEKDRHTALGDALATREVHLAMRQHAKEKLGLL